MHMQRIIERARQLEQFKRRYRQRGKEGKSRLLDEFCEHYGYERKYAIKLGVITSPAPVVFHYWPSLYCKAMSTKPGQRYHAGAFKCIQVHISAKTSISCAVACD